MPNITVHVYLWQTETPIPQATVTVTGYPSVLTNSSGVAVIPNVVGDQTQTITTQKSGYQTDIRSPYISSQDYSTTVYLQLGAVTYSNLTITVSGQGTTDPPTGNYPNSYEVGTNLTVAANPASGWYYIKMRRNSVDATVANPGEFLNLQATETIEVIFEQTIQPPPSGGGFPVMLLVPIAGIVTVGLIWWAVKK